MPRAYNVSPVFRGSTARFPAMIEVVSMPTGPGSGPRGSGRGRDGPPVRRPVRLAGRADGWRPCSVGGAAMSSPRPSRCSTARWWRWRGAGVAAGRAAEVISIGPDAVEVRMKRAAQAPAFHAHPPGCAWT